VTRSSLDDINLLDLDRWARDGAPHDWFARLRAEAPVWRHPSPAGGRGFWVISRRDDVVELGRCPHALSSDADNGGVSGLGPGDELQDATDEVGAQTDGVRTALGNDAKMLLTLDPPEHTAYRKVVNRGFTPRTIARTEGRIRHQLGMLLDRLPANESVDFVTSVSMPLPMRVIGDLLGAPPEDHERILRWSNESVAATDPEYRSGPDSMQGALLSLFQYFAELRASAGRRPGDDLISVLLEATVDGQELSPVRFAMFLFLLAVAGNETTRTAISHAVLAFHQYPDQWRRLREDPSLIATTVDEVLRWSTPVLYFRRNAVTEMQVGGEVLAPGDIVSLWYVSANRDERHFDAPERFDVGRRTDGQVSFGGGGPHFCLGASLARLELRVLLEELVARYDRIDVVGPVERLRSNFLHGIKHVPVRAIRQGAGP
jgi:cholest-4-en-3-one 26-monooxygenase